MKTIETNKVVRQAKRNELAQRIKKLYASGMSLRDVGFAVKKSHEYVRQVVGDNFVDKN